MAPDVGRQLPGPLRMTLAKISAVFLYCCACALWCAAQNSQSSQPPPAVPQQQSSASQPASGTKPQTAADAKQSSASATTSKSHPAKKKKNAAHKGSKKSTTSVKCDPPASAASTSPASSTATPADNSNITPAPAESTGTKPASSASTASQANCPPKTVIREGGTSEPTIQLLGGPGGQQASNERATTDQLLHSTQDNLNKIAGKTLTSSQQEMITQIQQFVQQSKTALAAGDTERGRNLAMKAHLLSDELVKPQ